MPTTIRRDKFWTDEGANAPAANAALPAGVTVNAQSAQSPIVGANAALARPAVNTPYESLDASPCCGADFEEMAQCKCCGQLYRPGDNETLCSECEETVGAHNCFLPHIGPTLGIP